MGKYFCGIVGRTCQSLFIWDLQRRSVAYQSFKWVITFLSFQLTISLDSACPVLPCCLSLLCLEWLSLTSKVKHPMRCARLVLCRTRSRWLGILAWSRPRWFRLRRWGSGFGWLWAWRHAWLSVPDNFFQAICNWTSRVSRGMIPALARVLVGLFHFFGYAALLDVCLLLNFVP